MAAPSPIGKRGEKRWFFDVPADHEAWSVPGVSRTRYGSLAAPWAQAHIVANLLGLPAPAMPPVDYQAHFPGWATVEERWRAKPPRSYQPECVQYTAYSPYYFCALAMRGGKTRVGLDACDVIQAKRVVIVTPKSALIGWGTEINAVYEGRERLGWLKGRAGEILRIWCNSCDFTGIAIDGQPCRDCDWHPRKGRGLGYISYEIKDLLPPNTHTDYWHCSIHKEIQLESPGKCPVCQGEWFQAFIKLRFLACSYGSLIGQVEIDNVGKGHDQSARLPGAGSQISVWNPEVLICDEAHKVKSPQSATAKQLNVIAEASERVWLLTGTPISDDGASTWTLLDMASNHSWGKKRAYEARWWQGSEGTYGWTCSNAINSMTPELKLGINSIMIHKDRSVIDAGSAEITMIDRVVENDNEVLGHSDTTTLDAKIEEIIEELILELRDNVKIILGCIRPKNSDMLVTAARKAIKKAKLAYSPPVFQMTAQHDLPERNLLCKSFREHEGAAVFVSSYEIAGPGTHLAGARSIYVCDWPETTDELRQFIARANFMGRDFPMRIIFWSLEGSADQERRNTLLAKMRVQTNLLAAVDAQEILTTLEQPVDIDALNAELEHAMRAQKQAESEEEEEEYDEDIPF